MATPPPNLPFEPLPPPPPPRPASSVPPPPPSAPAPAPQAPPLAQAPKMVKEPEDIFSTMETPAASSKARGSAPAMMPAHHASFSAGKVLAVILGVLIVVGLGGFAFWYFVIRMPASSSSTLPPTLPVQTGQPVVQPATSVPAETAPEPANSAPTSASETTLPPPITTPPPGVNVPAPTSVNAEPEAPATSASTSAQSTLDTDHDGLTDVREIELGLDPKNPDTDGDGVSDGDEVLKYDTNPLNRDTDGDGFSDGQEIKNGYNPRGAGKCTKSDCTP